MQNLTPQQKIALVIVGLVVVLGILALILGSGGSSAPKVVSSTTESTEGVFLPRALTTFTLDKELPEGSHLEAVSYPFIAHTVNVDGTTVTARPRGDLFDGTPYNIWLNYYADAEADPVEIGRQDFRTPEFTKRRDFLNSLPKKFGDFTVFRISELTIYVLTEKPLTDKLEQKIYSLLSANGVNTDRYTIDIDEPTNDPTQDLIVH